MGSGGMAYVFQNCIKETEHQLGKYQKNLNVLVQLLHALRQAQDVPAAQEPDVLLKSIFNRILHSQVTDNVTDDEKLEEQNSIVSTTTSIPSDERQPIQRANQPSIHSSVQLVNGDGSMETDDREMKDVLYNEGSEDDGPGCEEEDTFRIVEHIDSTQQTEEALGEGGSEVQEEDAQNEADALDDEAGEGVEEKDLELSVLFLGGPKIGVKYQIEVTSPLTPDGTFWACVVDETGFLNEKVEQLSEKLRESTKDSSLWKVDDFAEMVCVKSQGNGLWMRAIVIKETGDNSVKLLLIDIGRTESSDKSRLSRVPEPLCDIPYMAFHCVLFEDAVNVPYEGRWRFSDICKKKILNFTFEKSIERKGQNLLLGAFQTILDEPVIDVAAEIRRYGGASDKSEKIQDTSSIVSRDIRTQAGNNGSAFTSVVEVIRSNSREASDHELISTPEKIERQEATPQPHLQPLQEPLQEPQPSQLQPQQQPQQQLQQQSQCEPQQQKRQQQQQHHHHQQPQQQPQEQHSSEELSSPEQEDKTILDDELPPLSLPKTKAKLLVKIPHSNGGSCYSSDDKLSWGDRRTPTSAEMQDLYTDALDFTPDRVNCDNEHFHFDEDIERYSSDGGGDVISDTDCGIMNEKENGDRNRSMQNGMCNNGEEDEESEEILMKRVRELQNLQLELESKIRRTRGAGGFQDAVAAQYLNEYHLAQVPHVVDLTGGEEEEEEFYDDEAQNDRMSAGSPGHPIHAIVATSPENVRKVDRRVHQDYVDRIERLSPSPPCDQKRRCSDDKVFRPISLECSVPRSRIDKSGKTGKAGRSGKSGKNTNPIDIAYRHGDVLGPRFFRTKSGESRSPPRDQSDKGGREYRDRREPPRSRDSRDQPRPREKRETMGRWVPSHQRVSGEPRENQEQRKVPSYRESRESRDQREACDRRESRDQRRDQREFPDQPDSWDQLNSQEQRVPRQNQDTYNRHNEPRHSGDQCKTPDQQETRGQRESREHLGQYELESREQKRVSQDVRESLETPRCAPSQSRYSFAKQEHSRSPTTNPKSTPPYSRSPFDTYGKDNSSSKNSPSRNGGGGIEPKKISQEKDAKKFEEVSFELMLKETHNDWTARELYNLTHPYFEHKKARFFSVLIKSDSKGSFGTILMKALEKKILYLPSGKDCRIFEKKWKDNDGPLFILMRHQRSTNGIWEVGGILQVIARIQEVTHDPQWGRYGCQVKFVSTARIEDLQASAYVRPDLDREIKPEMARQYIRTLIRKLQEGDPKTVSNLFTKPEYTSGAYPKPAGRLKKSAHPEPPPTTSSCPPRPLMTSTEDWDLTLDDQMATGNEFGSDDEAELVDINMQMDVYGITDDDM